MNTTTLYVSTIYFIKVFVLFHIIYVPIIYTLKLDMTAYRPRDISLRIKIIHK